MASRIGLPCSMRSGWKLRRGCVLFVFILVALPGRQPWFVQFARQPGHRRVEEPAVQPGLVVVTRPKH
ncbi:hypothetical protein BEK98_13095 [Streptomyces diastatochromogenes]|uniref:Uncharacterized protein n=1 Tax=Streptomyces diastatochromogenes TaxID=42236 RepID=A0A233SKC6_STRDA|nr:hypothetical protein BEK98_13095 [Streptomyces diastatochromogenes]